MTIEFMAPEVEELKPRISVIGCGGAGGNAVANMIANQVQGVDFIVANTDAQALNSSAAERRIQLGLKITQGLGAGSRPEIGRAAAEEAIEQIERALEGSHMCFIAAGMGGGTGTGAAPIIAKAARDRGILTVGVVTKPFSFEGSRRMKSAEAGIAELQKHVDTLIVIPNQNLFLIANPQTTFKEAFAMADRVIIMAQGEIAQIGRAKDIYRSPSNKFVAEFVGRNNIFEGKVLSSTQDTVKVATSMGQFTVPQSARSANPGDPLSFVVAADLIQVSSQRPAADNVVECQIISEQFMGTTVTLFLEAPGGEELKVQIGQRELEQIDLKGGSKLFASWPIARAHVLQH